jgi:DNA-binding MarR family transcriptional regulator
VQVPAPKGSVEPSQLPFTYLASFIGIFADREVMQEMQRLGFGDLRRSHGFLVQHLLREPHSVGQLAELLGVTQQAASKTVSELRRAGYVESTRGPDARVTLVQLSERGQAAVRASRRARLKLERRLAAALGKRRFELTRSALADLLETLGGADAVRGRRVPSDET